MTFATAESVLPSVSDALGRALRDLRVSVTDRCNFRCPYCMPRSHFGPGHRFVAGAGALSVDETTRLTRVFVSLGATKVRLTGGEPLLRRDLESIVAGIAALGIADVALTTNGALLERRAEALRRAGLHRVTVSLDSLHPEMFAAMSDVNVPLERVLAGIRAAQRAGLEPVKLNCVVRRGVNDSGLLELVDFARRERLTVRFIEYMDVGTSNGWRLQDVVSGDEILARIGAVHRLVAEPGAPAAVARYHRFDDDGEVGVITSVSRPFCGDCTRARLSVDGRLFTCLFAADGLDLRTPLRSGATDSELRTLIAERWSARDDRYSELRASATTPAPRVEMSYIGG
ncbi:MAG: GTP 3',8-cyclase MoaA [Candidatus Dormibacteria bacterium]